MQKQSITKTLHRQRGWSLIDLVVGLTILLLTFLAGVAAFKIITRNRTNNIEMTRANLLELRTVESLRRDSIGENFDKITTPGTDKYTRAEDSPYKIWVTIDEINADRARFYTIKITGPHREFLRTGFMTRQRGRVSGGSIAVHVQDTDGNPVQNILCKAPAQDGGPDVTGYTTLTGDVTLDSVFAGAGTIMKVDTNGTLYYFTAAQGVNPSGFFKDFSLNTVSGVTIPCTVVMVAPSIFRVIVKDYDKGTPVEGAELRLYGRNTVGNLQVNNWGPYYTDVTGKTEFKLVPGEYTAYNLGSMQTTQAIRYAGTATPGDANTANRPWLTLTQGAVKEQLIRTLPVGKVHGNLKLVTFSAGKFVVDGTIPATESTNLMIDRNILLGNDNAVKSNPNPTNFSANHFDFLNTVAGSGQLYRYSNNPPVGCYQWQPGFNYSNSWCNNGDPGWVILRNNTPSGAPVSSFDAFVTPSVINADVDKYHEPYNRVSPSLSYWANPPVVPILVLSQDGFPADRDKVQFAGRFNESFAEFMAPPKINGSVIDENDRRDRLDEFAQFFRAGDTATMDFYLLHESALGSLHGDIRLIGGGSSPSFPKSKIWVAYGSAGLGVITKEGGSYRMKQSFTLNLTPNAANTSYDLNTEGFRRLVPDLQQPFGPKNMSQTIAYFEGFTESTISPEFDGRVKCWEKVLTNTKIDFVSRADSDCDVNNLGMRIYYWTGADTLAFDGKVDVQDGIFTKALANVPFKKTTYVGQTDPQQIDPGVDKKADIEIHSIGDTTYNFYARNSTTQSVPWVPLDTANHNFTAVDQTHFNMDPAVFTTITRVTPIQVYGYVTDPEGKPIVGATVRIHSIGLSDKDVVTSNAATCLGCTNETPTFPNPPTGFQFNTTVNWKHAVGKNLSMEVLESSTYYNCKGSEVELYYENQVDPSQPLTKIQLNCRPTRKTGGVGPGL